MALSLRRYNTDNSSLFELLKLRAKKERENARSISIAADEYGNRLPEDVLIEILSWLPAKEVLQYKSVCKTWYAILSSPQFISKHVRNNRGKCNDNCLLAVYQVTNGERLSYAFFFDENPHILKRVDLDGIPSCNCHALLYGPCDGLYYVYDHDGSFRALWNPTINEVRILPPITLDHNPPSAPIHPLEDCFSFGLDPVTGDYKVVVIYEYWDADTCVSHQYPISVFVYSLTTNSWKYCGDLARQCLVRNNKSYIFVKGCCFWWATNDYNDVNLFEVIISFDTTSDSIQELPVPKYENPAWTKLGMYRDSLVFFSVPKDPQALDIWTLNDGTWSKTFTLGPFQPFLEPVGFWKNQILAYSHGTLVLCDLNTQEIKDLAYRIPSRCLGMFSHMESLLSIKHSEIEPIQGR